MLGTDRCAPRAAATALSQTRRGAVSADRRIVARGRGYDAALPADAAARAAGLIAVAEDLAGEFSLRPLLQRILLRCTELLGCTADVACDGLEAIGSSSARTIFAGGGICCAVTIAPQRDRQDSGHRSFRLVGNLRKTSCPVPACFGTISGRRSGQG